MRHLSLVTLAVLVFAVGCTSSDDKTTSPVAPSLWVDESAVTIGYGETTSQITIRNSGNASLWWTAEADQPFIDLGTTSGSLLGGASVQVTVTVDLTGFETGSFAGTITVTSGTSVRLVAVQANHYNEDVTIINFTPVDAEYDATADRIVAVSANPDQIHIIDPVLKSDVAVALAAGAPTCISVHPAGGYAAVGHDAAVSYVNLGSGIVENVWPTSANAGDIVVGHNGWMYVFPTASGFTDIHCIDSTGTEQTAGIFALFEDTRAKVHPLTDYIYGAWPWGVSPTDFEKYDISGGVASKLYDSRYHGEYAFYGDIWITEDGFTLIARSGNLFDSTTDPGTDITYSGSLAGVDWIEHADHSTAAGNKVFVVTRPNSWDPPRLTYRVHDMTNGSLLASDLLPPALEAFGETYRLRSIRGYFIWCDSAGARVHFIGKLESSTDWALGSFDVP